MPSATSGTIKRITDRGFGFITAPDGVEYFFHQSACTEHAIRLSARRRGGDIYTRPGPEGSSAENVTPA